MKNQLFPNDEFWHVIETINLRGNNPIREFFIMHEKTEIGRINTKFHAQLVAAAPEPLQSIKNIHALLQSGNETEQSKISMASLAEAAIRKAGNHRRLS